MATEQAAARRPIDLAIGARQVGLLSAPLRDVGAADDPAFEPLADCWQRTGPGSAPCRRAPAGRAAAIGAMAGELDGLEQDDAIAMRPR